MKVEWAAQSQHVSTKYQQISSQQIHMLININSCQQNINIYVNKYQHMLTDMNICQQNANKWQIPSQQISRYGNKYQNVVNKYQRKASKSKMFINISTKCNFFSDARSRFISFSSSPNLWSLLMLFLYNYTPLLNKHTQIHHH